MDVEPSDLEAPARAVKPRPAHGVGLVRALATLLIGFVLAQLFGKLAAELARAVTHVDTSALTGAVVVPSMLASESALVLVAIAAPLTLSLPPMATLGLLAPAPVRVFLAAALGTVMLGPLGDQLMTWFSAAFPSLTLGVVPTLHDLAQSLPLVWLWPAFALLPGLGEELLFRGVLQRSIACPRLAVVISGVAFALFHVDPVHVMGVLPLGLFLAWVAQRSSTAVTVVAHVINNSVALASIRSGDLDVGFGSERALPPAWLAASILIFAAAAVVVAHETRLRSRS